MAELLATWVFLGTMCLAILTYQDMKKRVIDDRWNWFMQGANSVFIALMNLNIVSLLFAVLSAVFLNVFWKIVNTKLLKTEALGSGDASALNWICIGLVMLSPFAWAWYGGIFIAVAIIYFATKNILKIKQPTPFFPVISASFVAFCLIWGLY